MVSPTITALPDENREIQTFKYRDEACDSMEGQYLVYEKRNEKAITV